MIRKIAEYTIREGEMDIVLAAIRKFLAAIEEHEPETVYEAYIGDGERNFVHLMVFPDTEAEHTHQTAAYTGAFVAELYPKCEIQPRFTDLVRID